jgi:hypothetical protein
MSAVAPTRNGDAMPSGALMVFGFTGDLAKKKVIPSLYATGGGARAAGGRSRRGTRDGAAEEAVSRADPRRLGDRLTDTVAALMARETR